MNPAPLSKIELSFSCRNLPNLDTLSKSDPMVWVEINQGNGQWAFLGKTEMIKDNLNPNFQTRIPVNYYFEEVQQLRFTIVDVDNSNINSIQGQDQVGCVTMSLSDIVGSRSQQATREIMHPTRKSSGILIVSAEEMGENNMNFVFRISGHHLDKKDFLGKSDPFLELSKQKGGGEWIVFHRTEVVKQNINPRWRQFELPAARMCNDGDFTTPIKFACFDWDSDSKTDFIGEFITSLAELQQGREFNLINEKKRAKKKKYTNSGVITIDDLQEIRNYSFLDYIVGGTEINLMVAIDYTASNGDPTSPQSLHYMQPGLMNQYAQVIHAVGNILVAYDSDNMIPTYGFGARLPSGEVSHCFHVNGNPSNPEVYGVEGVLQAYQNSLLSGLSLYGPTNFGGIIKTASTISEQLHHMNQDVQSYLILLILTDGEISDMGPTMQEIVNASFLPMSIVIVGVGNANFDKMDVLDGDGGLLQSGGRYAQRDIVQFVPYRNYANQDISRLAAATLAEIPGQFTDYMKKNGIVPHAPPTQDELAQMQQQQMQALANNPQQF